MYVSSQAHGLLLAEAWVCDVQDFSELEERYDAFGVRIPPLIFGTKEEKDARIRKYVSDSGYGFQPGKNNGLLTRKSKLYLVRKGVHQNPISFDKLIRRKNGEIAKSKQYQEMFVETILSLPVDLENKETISKAAIKMARNVLYSAQDSQNKPSKNQLAKYLIQKVEIEAIELFARSSEKVHVDHIIPRSFLSFGSWKHYSEVNRLFNLRLVHACDNASRQNNLKIAEILQFTREQRELYNLCDRIPQSNRFGEIYPRKLPIDDVSWQRFKHGLEQKALVA